MSEQDAQDAHAAGEQAAADRQGHYHGNVLGQGAAAGDPQPAESTLQPVPVNMRPAVSDADPVGSL